MAKKNRIEELKTLDAQCGNAKRVLDTAYRNLDMMAEIEVTRDSAMVRTKIDEARMWLDKYWGAVNVELANKTCR